MSMERHCWYLNVTLVPLALLDPDLPDVERENIAKTFSKPVPDQFPPLEKSNLFKDLHFKQETPKSCSIDWGELLVHLQFTEPDQNGAQTLVKHSSFSVVLC